MVPTRIGGGSTRRPATARSSSTQDVKAMPTTLRRTKSVRITVETPEVSHNASRERLSRIPTATLSSVEDPPPLPPLARLTTIVTMMEPPTDAVQLKPTLAR